MKATYEKVTNLIIVELTADEATKYCATEISEKDLNLRATVDEQNNPIYMLTIPCGSNFYQMTQRRQGGVQPWGPDQLRQAIRAAVANRLVHWPGPWSPQEFKEYKTKWSAVHQSLLRNVRLKFPNSKHPRARLSYEEHQFRKNWRAKHISR